MASILHTFKHKAKLPFRYKKGRKKSTAYISFLT